jgi:hypothetical protein
VESLPPLWLQPALHLSAFVGAVIIHHEVHFPIGRELGFEVVEKPCELAAAMTIPAGSDHFAVQDIERGEQSGSAVTFIVVRLTFRQARPQGNDRSGAGPEPESGSSRPRTVPAQVWADSGTSLRYPAPFPRTEDRSRF